MDNRSRSIIDDQVERRRNSLLGAPNQRRTLLASGNGIMGAASAFIMQPDVPAKRRKGLLSTPEVGPTRMSGTATESRPSDCGLIGRSAPSVRRPAAAIAAVSTSSSTVTPCAPAPSSSRRVLLSYSPKDKGAEAAPVATSSPHDEAKPAHSVGCGLLEAAGGAVEGKLHKWTMTEATDTDMAAESDLSRLHQRRMVIDRRIAELQEAADKGAVKKDMVTYVNGYYCRACRKFIRGDYAAKAAHCGESAHVYNSDEYLNDPDTVLKYFEERYEGMAFDDEDDVVCEEVNTSKSVGSDCLLDKWSSQSASSQSWVSPGATRKISTGSRAAMHSPGNVRGAVSSDSSAAFLNGGKPNTDQRWYSVDSDDEDEEDASRERFDRTRISRSTAVGDVANGTSAEETKNYILKTFSKRKNFDNSQMASATPRHQTACAHRSLPRYYSNNYGKQSAGVVGNGIVYSSASPHLGACDDSYLASGGRKSDAADSSLMEGYELSTDFQQKHVEMLERKYGGRIRARRAAVVIQRVYRKYRLEKKFENLRLVATDRRSGGRGRVGMNRFHSTANNIVPAVVASNHVAVGQRYSDISQQRYRFQQYTKRIISTRSDGRIVVMDDRRGAACSDVISQEAPADGVYEMKRYGARVILGNQQHGGANAASLSSNKENNASKTTESKSKLKLHRYNIDGGGRKYSGSSSAGQLQHEDASPRGSVAGTVPSKVAEAAMLENEEGRYCGSKYRPPAVNILRNRSLSVERAAVLGGPVGCSLSVLPDKTMENPVRREEARQWQQQIDAESVPTGRVNELDAPYASYIRLAPSAVTQQHSSGNRAVSSRPAPQQFGSSKPCVIHHSAISDGWNSYNAVSSLASAAEGRPYGDAALNYAKYHPGAAAVSSMASSLSPSSAVTDAAATSAHPASDNVIRQSARLRRADSDHAAPVWLPMAVGVEDGRQVTGQMSAITDPSRVNNETAQKGTVKPLPCQQPVLTRSIPESQWLRHWGRRSLISAPQRQTELERKRQYRIALNFFNKKPERGVQFLVDFGFVEGTPAAVAKLLISRKGLSKQMIGEYLGNLLNPFNMAVLDCFANEVDMTCVDLDVALRRFQSLFRLPGEAQKIERIMEVFARRYCDCNQEVVKQFRQADTIFLLAFAIIMLNTDLHSPNIKPERRMKVEDFFKNLRGIDGGSDVDAKLLTGIYQRVKDQEFKPGSDHVTQVLKVDRSIVGKKPTLALPHRRLVCYCRLYEVMDAQKKQAVNVHQREIFLFNDMILITKILSRKKNAVTYAFRSCHSLVGMQVQSFKNQYYANGLRINHTLENKTLLFNARSDEDRTKFMEDLKESIFESDEMEALRIELELEKQNKFCGNSNAAGTSNRSHSLSRGEQRDSGLPELDDAAAIAPGDAFAASTSGAQVKPVDRARDTKPRCASLTSLDSGMSSTASTVSRESSPKNARPSTSSPQDQTQRAGASHNPSTLSKPQKVRAFVDGRNRRHSGSLTPPPEVAFFTESSEV